MNPDESASSGAAATAWSTAAASGSSRPLLADLNARNLALTLALGVVTALLISPIYITPLPVLLGRTLFLALCLLVAYALAARWPTAWLPSWLPRGAVQVLAVAVTAPLASLAAYALTVDVGLEHILATPGLMLGFLVLAGAALLIGGVLVPVALLREQQAQARSQALQFALERSVLEKQALDARLSLLQAQIEPHFLFNTLANVQALVETGSPRAPAVLRSLIAYLRAAMPRLHDGHPTLGNELGLARAYLELMQMRMPDRLRFELNVPESLRQRPFPAMALLTLVENAVRHGVDPVEDGGHIEVGGRARDDGGCVLWVQDTGVGLSPHALPGTGLENLRSRLAAFFGPAAQLQMTEVNPHGLRVELLLPPEGKA